jgi:hypothetical protein
MIYYEISKFLQNHRKTVLVALFIVKSPRGARSPTGITEERSPELAVSGERRLRRRRERCGKASPSPGASTGARGLAWDSPRWPGHIELELEGDQGSNGGGSGPRALILGPTAMQLGRTGGGRHGVATGGWKRAKVRWLEWIFGRSTTAALLLGSSSFLRGTARGRAGTLMGDRGQAQRSAWSPTHTPGQGGTRLCDSNATRRRVGVAGRLCLFARIQKFQFHLKSTIWNSIFSPSYLLNRLVICLTNCTMWQSYKSTTSKSISTWAKTPWIARYKAPK